MSNKKFILFIDNDPISQELIRLYSTNRGWVVATVPNGKNALEVTEAVFWDLIFIEIGIAKNEIFQQAKTIKEYYNSCGKCVPIIGVTEPAAQGDIKNHLSQGIDDYISKPVTSNTLFSIISKHLTSKHPATESKSSRLSCLKEVSFEKRTT